MSLAHTILGVLMDAPSHGYSLKKRLAGRLSDDLDINDGRLYPTLGRLESSGWITKEIVEQRRSPNKHLYRVTPAGRKAFFRWLEGSEPEDPPERLDFFWRSQFLQKCNFFRHLEPGDIRRLVRKKLDEVSRCEEKLKHVLEDLEGAEPDAYRRMIVDYGVRYQRMRREWLHELLSRATEHEGSTEDLHV